MFCSCFSWSVWSSPTGGITGNLCILSLPHSSSSYLHIVPLDLIFPCGKIPTCSILCGIWVVSVRYTICCGPSVPWSRSDCPLSEETMERGVHEPAFSKTLKPDQQLSSYSVLCLWFGFFFFSDEANWVSCFMTFSCVMLTEKTTAHLLTKGSVYLLTVVRRVLMAACLLLATLPPYPVSPLLMPRANDTVFPWYVLSCVWLWNPCFHAFLGKPAILCQRYML